MRFQRVLLESKDKSTKKKAESQPIPIKGAANMIQTQEPITEDGAEDLDRTVVENGAGDEGMTCNGTENGDVHSDGQSDTQTADVRQRKNGIFGGASRLFVLGGGSSSGSQRRISTGAESMSCSSQDSEDVSVPTMTIKRLSSETGSVSMASTSSAASSSSSYGLDELDELLLAVHGQLAESESRRSDVVAFEDSYRESKALIRQIAQDLVMKIRAHEARLLEEIEARKETMYKQLGLGHGRDKLDKIIKQMEKLHADGEAIMSEAALQEQLPETSPQYNTVVNNLREKVKEAENMPGADVKVLPICLNPVRCNTAFACLDQSCQNGASGGSICNRRKSMPHSIPHSPSKPCAAFPRVRNGSLQASASCGGNMQQLAIMESSSSNGVSNGGALPLERRISVAHHSTWNHPSNSAQLSPTCLSESYEDSAKTHLLWEVLTEGPAPGQINCPNDIAYLPNGQLVVSDRDNHRLQIFDEDGKCVRSIGEGKIKPRRIAITREGHIAMTDSKDNVVKVFDTQGNLISTWGKKRFKQMFKSPCGIACTKRGQFIISDMERHTVSMYASDGKLIKHLGGRNNSSTAEFHSPSYIAVNPVNNDIIVADNWTHSVQIFNEHGNFKLNTECNNDLKYPNGITCGGNGSTGTDKDSTGSVYVALWGSHAVAEFSTSGKFAGTVLSRGEHSIYHPAGISVHGNKLAVSEYSDSHSALRCYRLNNCTPSKSSSG